MLSLNGNDMNKPNFFIVGAPRCGTTSLAENLSRHPEVFLPEVKEPFYFVKGVRFNDYAEYLALFDKAGGAKAIGDASTGYLFDRNAPREIKKLYPDARIIIMLRNPVDMSFSHWRYVRISGDEKMGFEESISDEQRAYRHTEEFKKSVYWHGFFLHLDKALYHDQVKRYFDVFGPERVKVYIFEDFIRDQAASYRDIYSFLGVDPVFRQEFKKSNEGGEIRFSALQNIIHHRHPFLKRIVPIKFRIKARKTLRLLNTRKGKSEMNPQTRARLQEFFRPDIEKLESLLGYCIDAWKDR